MRNPDETGPETPLLDPALSDDPLAIVHSWLAAAARSEPNDPTAAALATASPTGMPSVRMVLVKPAHNAASLEAIFRFFTNADSAKGRDLAANPHAALCLHWKSLRRQLRVEGRVTQLPPAVVDEYFHSRGRRSQIGAAISRQSQPLPSRQTLVEQAAAFATHHPGTIPRPPHWCGYQLSPTRIEFWIDGPDRLHDRFAFTPTEPTTTNWTRHRLYP